MDLLPHPWDAPHTANPAAHKPVNGHRLQRPGPTTSGANSATPPRREAGTQPGIEPGNCLGYRSPMTTATESLLEQVLALPEDERQEFLTSLQARLPELADGELSDEWIDELDRRLADVESGNVPTVRWDAVKGRLLAKYVAE